jgi:hypothetical protein
MRKMFTSALYVPSAVLVASWQNVATSSSRDQVSVCTYARTRGELIGVSVHKVIGSLAGRGGRADEPSEAGMVLGQPGVRREAALTPRCRQNVRLCTLTPRCRRLPSSSRSWPRVILPADPTLTSPKDCLRSVPRHHDMITGTLNSIRSPRSVLPVRQRKHPYSGVA